MHADVASSVATSEEVVAAMAEGDSGTALSVFYREYASTVFALLTKMLGSQADAEEIMQDVFVELWRGAPQYDPKRGSVIAWVLTIARSRALDALKARTRRYQDLHRQFSERHGLGTDGGRPDVLASATRWHRALNKAFGALSDDQRAALELSYFLGMSHTQIAELLNLPVGTVKSRILLGLRALRAALPDVHGSLRD